MGQPMVAVGVTRTRPPSAAETRSGAKMLQALRPRIDETCVTYEDARTCPEAMHLASARSRHSARVSFGIPPPPHELRKTAAASAATGYAIRAPNMGMTLGPGS